MLRSAAVAAAAAADAPLTGASLPGWWSSAGEDSSWHTRSRCALPPRRICVGENAEMRACVKLLCPGAVPSYGEEGEQRTALHRAVWELFGRAVLISTTQTSLCSPQSPACPPSPPGANV